MDWHVLVLVAALVSLGLSAGVFFTFTTLVVPGLMDLDERSGLQGFQAIDGRLQGNPSSVNWQPAFFAALFGASALTVAAAVVGWVHLSATAGGLAVVAAATYNLGFLLPTFLTILPFNNRVHDLDLDAMDRGSLGAVHADFERNWRGWNLVRTVSSTAALTLLATAVVIG